MDEKEKLLDYTRRFLNFRELSETYRYGCVYSTSDVINILLPTYSKERDTISLLPYEYRIEIAKMYLEKITKYNLRNFNYYKGSFSTYKDEFKEILSTDGYKCNVDVHCIADNGTPIYDTKMETFHQIYLDELYRLWDSQIDNWKEEKQKVVEMIFEYQLSGRWFYYNGLNQNFLRIYLEYLKNKGYRINIFDLFKKKIENIAGHIKQGLSHYTKSYLFESLLIIFDFYMAILDLYGEENKKVIDRLQNTLNYIFKEKLNVEKLGFMNTFLYTKKYDNDRRENYDDVSYFWMKLYNGEMNTTLKRIFINALIYTWNKSPIPKVRNSIQLIANLSTYNYNCRGFPYENQNIFYKDLIVNANSLKKSVKQILFAKAVTQEGGLYLGG